jgi:hypothetical protein
MKNYAIRMIEKTSTLQAIDLSVDHVRGPEHGPLLVEYGDYECPYSRQAFREIERVEQRLAGGLRFAFRHFPLTEIHPHALSAAAGQRRTRSDSGRYTDASSTARRRSRRKTSAATPVISPWIRNGSTKIGRAKQSLRASAETSIAESSPARCAGHRRFS